MTIFALKDTQAQVVKHILVFKDEDMAKQAMQDLLYDKYAVNKIQLFYKHFDLYKLGTMSDRTMEFNSSVEFVCSLSSLVRPDQQHFLDILYQRFYNIEGSFLETSVDYVAPGVDCVNEVSNECKN